MPRISDKQQFLKELNKLLTIAILEEDDVEDLALLDHGDLLDPDEPMLLLSEATDLAELYTIAENTRYIVPRMVVLKSSEFMDKFFLTQPVADFRQQTRMSQDAFRHIVRVIEGNPIFFNDSNTPQAAVYL